MMNTKRKYILPLSRVVLIEPREEAMELKFSDQEWDGGGMFAREDEDMDIDIVTGDSGPTDVNVWDNAW